MGRNVDVSSERPSVRRRAAAAIYSKRRTRSATHDRNSLTVLATEQPGQLIAEGPLERTTTVRQADIRAAVDSAASARGSFALDLSGTRLSPYTHSRYSRSGKSLLVCSERGHIAVADWRTATLRAELFLNETVRDATFLHSDTYFAVAQKKSLFIYDNSGIELHALRHHREPGKITFLPHHLLLVSSSCTSAAHSRIVYTDTSTGEEVANHDFGARKLNLTPVLGLCHNASNGVVHAGHANGVATLWGPTTSQPLARIFAQAGGVRHLTCDAARNTMITLGHDGNTKVWDLRMFRTLCEKRTMPLAMGMAVSQRSLLAICGAATVQIWRASDLENKRGGKAYLSERYPGKRPTSVDFCPFEDVLAVSYQNGICSMLVPGAGEPQFDSRAPNPYQTNKQAREAEVRMLLDKLPAESIALDPGFIGTVDEDPMARKRDIDAKVRAAAAKKREKKLGVKKAKGKNKISKRVKRKEAHNVESKRFEKEARKESVNQLHKEAARIQALRDANDVVGHGDRDKNVVPATGILPLALNRFLPKRRGETGDQN